MTYALHTEFFFLFFIVIIAINANRKLLVFMYYGRAFHSLTLSLARSLLPLAQSSMGCTQLRGGGEKKNTENCRSENVSFPVLWFIQWEHFFLILWCEKLFFAFISSSTPLFFHHRWCVSECFWIFFLESCIVLWVMRTFKWTFVHVSVFNWFSFLIRKMFCIRNCKS